MIKIEKFKNNILAENCYVMSDETNECVIIDCGAYEDFEVKDITDYIAQNNLQPVHLLATHGHIDHNFGNGAMFKAYGLKVEVHLKDQPLMDNMSQQEQLIFGQQVLKEPLPTVGRYFTEKDVITFGNHSITIIETPGHTPGGVFFYLKDEKVAFSGDTLFKGSIGRTDLPGGSMFGIIQSLRMICQMPDEVHVYPGHGEDTTIGYECQTNMYLDR